MKHEKDKQREEREKKEAEDRIIEKLSKEMGLDEEDPMREYYLQKELKKMKKEKRKRDKAEHKSEKKRHKSPKS